MKLEIVYLKEPGFLNERVFRFAHGHRVELSATRAAALRHVLQGGATPASVLEKLSPEEQAGVDLRSPTGLLGVIEIELPHKPEILLVEQGYGGVYVHSVELFRHLSRRWKSLLLSPVRPLFEPEPIPGVLSLDQLQKRQPELTYYAWVQVVRSLVRLCQPRLMMIMHRSQSLYLFDLLKEVSTVIYCDGFYDAVFRDAFDFRREDTEPMRDRVLQEIQYLTSCSNFGFMGIYGDPGVNIHQLTAGAFSLESAVENWCWGAEQRAHFVRAFPQLEDSVKLMLPFTDPDLFQPGLVRRERRPLFTTTMHNIDKKGLPELVQVMNRQRKLEVDCIVRQPEHLPPIPAGVRGRMHMRSLPKPKMVELYHTAWFNFRVSREESSPMSILESMTCELPQIVSNRVAEQIPIIEDGATGFVVDPDDRDRTEWAVKTLLADQRLRDRLGRECRRRTLDLAFSARVSNFEALMS
jgi:glycosyltransferase involved in cell wall biosynthesis